MHRIGLRVHQTIAATDYLCGGGATVGFCQMCSAPVDCPAHPVLAGLCYTATCNSGQCFYNNGACANAGDLCANGYECASTVCTQGSCANN